MLRLDGANAHFRAFAFLNQQFRAVWACEDGGFTHGHVLHYFLEMMSQPTEKTLLNLRRIHKQLVNTGGHSAQKISCKVGELFILSNKLCQCCKSRLSRNDS